MEQKINELVQMIQKGPRVQAERKEAVRELGELLGSQELVNAAQQMKDISAGEAGFIEKHRVFVKEGNEGEVWALLNKTLMDAGYPPASKIEDVMEHAVGDITPQQAGEWYGDEAVTYVQKKMDGGAAPHQLKGYLPVLRWVKSQAALDLLLLYRNHENKEVRIEAFKAFAGHGSPELLKELQRDLNTETDYKILEAIMEGVGGFTFPGMEAFFFDLIRTSEQAGPRLTAATSLAKMGEMQGLLALVEEMTADKDNHSRISNILGGIKRSEAPAAVDVLIELTKHPHFRVRQYSVEALAWVTTPAVLEAIKAVLLGENHKENYVTREKAVKSLANHGESAVPVLAQAMDDVDRPQWAEAKPHIYKTIGEYAREAMQRIGSPEAIEILTAWKEQNES